MKILFAVPALCLTLSCSAAFGQTPQSPMTVLAQSSESRFMLVFHVDDAALAKMLPAGWVPAIPAQGPAKDTNIRVIFIDAGNITGPDNKPLGKGSDLMVIVAAPVKKTDGSGTGQMILGGVTQNDPSAAFGVLDQADTAKVTRNSVNANGSKIVTEDWDLAAANGAHYTLHVKYTSLPANRGSTSTNFYNPADPKSFQIFQTEQVTDIIRNTNTKPPDRLAEYSLKVSGKFAALLDGSQKGLSWDSQPVFNRIIGTPAAAP